MTSIDEIVWELSGEVERALATDVHVIAIGRSRAQALLSALARSRRMEVALRKIVKRNRHGIFVLHDAGADMARIARAALEDT
jgi:hypothetical protein